VQVPLSRSALADRRITVYLFLLTFIVYSWFWAGGGWNQNANFDLTRALVENRTVAIDEFVSNTGDFVFREGHYFANKAPGLSLLAAVPYTLLYAFARWREIDSGGSLALSINAYLCSLFACALPGALIPSLLYRYGRRELELPASWVLTVSLIAGFATPLFPWATVMITHVPSAGFLFLAFCELFSSRPRPILAGASAGLAGLMNYLCIPIAALFLLWSFFASGKVKSLRFAIGALPLAAIFLWYQQAAFGSPYRNPATMNETFMTRGAWLGLIEMPSLEALIGVTISPYRGIFYYAPVLVFALSGAVVFYRQRRFEHLWIAGATIIFFLAFNCTFNNWEGGFGAAARYLMPAVPFLALLMLAAHRVLPPLLVALASISAVNSFAVAAVDPQPNASIQSPLTDYVYPLLFTGRFSSDLVLPRRWSADLMHGHVSVVRQTLEEVVPFAIYPPGSIETEWASFNLGELLSGPGRVESLVAVILIMLLGTGALFVLARRVDTEPPETSHLPLQP